MYTPSQRSVDKILISLGLACGKEFALPGNWSPKLFVDDLFVYPVETKDRLCVNMYKGMAEGWTYRKFFEESRGRCRDIPNPVVWDIFDKGHLMLVGEGLFLQLIERSDDELNPYLKTLSEAHISQWSFKSIPEPILTRILSGLDMKYVTSGKIN